MSWSCKNIAASKENLEREIADAQIESPTVVTQEMKDGLHVGKQAAMKLFENLDKIGDYPYYGISITGHANSGHRQTPGWSNDGVSVSIYGLTEEDLKYWTR